MARLSFAVKEAAPYSIFMFVVAWLCVCVHSRVRCWFHLGGAMLRDAWLYLYACVYYGIAAYSI